MRALIGPDEYLEYWDGYPDYWEDDLCEDTDPYFDDYPHVTEIIPWDDSGSQWGGHR